jgi:serine/threonine-protein phosphatase 2A regulatory subunit B'
VNPQLFDDCSHEYSEQQNAMAEKQTARQARWDKLDQLAKANKGKTAPVASSTAPVRAVGEEGDPLENQRRMEALRLQDDPHRTSSSVRE